MNTLILLEQFYDVVRSLEGRWYHRSYKTDEETQLMKKLSDLLDEMEKLRYS